MNAITPAFAAKLGLSTQITNVGAQKIDGSALKIYGKIIAEFWIQDEFGKIRFFQETFLLSDTSIDVVLGMSFLSLSNTDIQFDTWNLTWRIYSTIEALPTTRQVELIDKHEFARAALNENFEIFVVHGAAQEALELAIHPSRAPLLAVLQKNKALTKIPLEYVDYVDVFFLDLVMELSKNTGINEYTIKLIEGKQPPYRYIYSLGPVELDTLKACIKTHLKTGFIRPSKSPIGTPIFFDKKLNGSLWLYVDYRGLINLIIKNRYPLPLIGESLDRLCRAKRFTHLDLTSAYHQMKIWEGDKWKTAFRTRYGHFEYQVISFGLSNASASF